MKSACILTAVVGSVPSCGDDDDDDDDDDEDDDEDDYDDYDDGNCDDDDDDDDDEDDEDDDDDEDDEDDEDDCNLVLRHGLALPWDALIMVARDFLSLLMVAWLLWRVSNKT